MPRHYAKKVDDNHKAIVAALRKAGCFVQSLAAQGGGVPDLLVAYDGFWKVLEIKDGGKCQSKQKLTPKQVRWIFELENRAPVYVVTSEQEALNIMRGKQ